MRHEKGQSHTFDELRDLNATLHARVNEEVQHLRGKIRERDRALREYRKDHGVLESFFRDVRSSIEPIRPLASKYAPRSRKGRVSTPCVAVAQSSDGHLGTVQEPDEIEGFCAFNPEICRARQLGFTQDFLEWVDLHRNAYTIDEMTHLVTGDMISGDIHEELRVTNAFPSPVQAVEAGKLLAEQVSLEAQHFKHVTVEFVVEDNHARLVKKPQAKEAGKNTLNYVVGEVARAYLRDHANVTFNLYPVYETVVHVATRQYLVCHGHGVRGWAGFPWYGVERKVGKESTARLQLIMEDIGKAQRLGFHRYVFGHFHCPIELPLYMACGSVQGTDAFDHKQGRYAKPSQRAWMVHPDRGEFDKMDFHLEHHDPKP